MASKYHLLFMEDDNTVQASMSARLSSAFTLHTAVDPDSLPAIFRKHPVQAALIDCNVVRHSGGPFLKRVKTRTAAGVVILTGGKKDMDLAVDMLNAGLVTEFIQKPLKPSELIKAIKSAISAGQKTKKKSARLKALENMVAEMNFLHTISQQISAKKPLPRLLSEIMEGSKLLMGAEASSLLLYDNEDKKLHFFVATGSKGKLMKKFSLSVGQGIGGWVAKHKAPALIKDCYNDPRFARTYDQKTKFKTRSMICVPLIRKKKLLGVMQVINKKAGGEFDEHDLTIFETLASYCAIAIENTKLTEIQVATEALERELETARDIQERSLPSVLPEYADIQVAARLIPAKQVGGDYYNIIRIDDDRSLFIIADVAGKGVPAALIVSTLWAYLSSYFKLNSGSFDLMAMVTGLNKVIIEATTCDRFVTAWFGLFHHATKKLISLNAGHNPPYIFRNGVKKIELEAGGIFLGGFDLPYQTEELEMKPSDCLVFFTDGVTEAFNTKEEEYDNDRLIGVVEAHVKKDAATILEATFEDVKVHVGRAEQSDDITCVVIKIN